MKLSLRSWIEITMLAAIAVLLVLMFILKRPQYPTYTQSDFERLADSAAVRAATVITQNQNALWKDLDSSNQAIAKQIRDGNQRLERIGTIVANIPGSSGGGHSETLTVTHAVYSDPEIWIKYWFPPKDSFEYKQRDHEIRVKVVETDTGSYVHIFDITSGKDVFVKDAQFVRYSPKKPFWASIGVQGGVLYRNPPRRALEAGDLAAYGLVETKAGSVIVYRGLKAAGSDWGFGIARRVK